MNLRRRTLVAVSERVRGGGGEFAVSLGREKGIRILSDFAGSFRCSSRLVRN